MPKMSRSKGARGEREVIRMLQPIVDRICGAGELMLQRNSLQSRAGGCDVYGLEWLSLEVKRQEQASVETWWKQAKAQAGEDQIPVMFWRGNLQPWRVRTIVEVHVGSEILDMVVDVSAIEFLVYFEVMLEHRWEDGEGE